MGPIRTHIIVALLLGTAACTVENPAYDPPDAVCASTEYFVGQPFTLADPGKVDILFVVDDSPGMLANQTALAEAMPRLVSRLEAMGSLDWRVGVISTDLSDDGVPRTGPEGLDGCPAELPEYVDGDTPSASLALSCNVLLGEDGSEFESGLDSARRAIEHGAAFLRSDARLVVVFFSDEDDCTAGTALDRSDATNCVWQSDRLVPASEFSGYFASSARRLSGNPVSVVAIVGPPDNRSYESGEEPEPACVGNSPALSGNRYIEVADTAPVDRHGFTDSICATSYIGTIDRIVDEAVDVDGDQVCVSLPMSGTPRAVILKASDGSTVGELSETGDYLTLGPTDRCPNGAVAIASDAHGATANVVEVRFCTTQNPAGS